MNEASAHAPDPSTGMYLEVGGRRLQVQVARRTTVRSPHTGRSLAELHARAAASDNATHRWLSETLKLTADRPVPAIDEAGDHLGRWVISWNAYGEVAGVHSYTLILRECEELNLEALVVDGIEIHPYEYREEVVGDGLTLWAKFVGTEEDVRRLRRILANREAVPVVRRGIQNFAREMRLGVGEWTEFEDRVKYRLVLVEVGVDEGAHVELARIRRENSRAALGFYMNFAEGLVDLLLEKGVLTEAEVEAVREASSLEPVAVGHGFWRVVADIDER